MAAKPRPELDATFDLETLEEKLHTHHGDLETLRVAILTLMSLIPEADPRRQDGIYVLEAARLARSSQQSVERYVSQHGRQAAP